MIPDRLRQDLLFRLNITNKVSPGLMALARGYNLNLVISGFSLIFIGAIL